MKRYLLFTGGTYYPKGGWDDFKIDADDLSALLVIAKESLTEKHGSEKGDPPYWYQIVDSHTGSISGMESKDG